MEHKIHPFAALLPTLPDDELQKLAEDIKNNGQRFSIVRWEGQIIEGRNRLKACEIIGVEPMFRDIGKDTLETDLDVAKSIISSNLIRRHLSASERAVLAVELIEMAKPKGTPMVPGEPIPDPADAAAPAPVPAKPDKASVKSAAELTGTSPSYVYRAAQVKDQDPKKFEEVKKGTKSIAVAKREIDRADPKKQTPEKMEKKAETIVKRCESELEKVGYRLVSSDIEKIDSTDDND
jgi:ParB-like chromosome segregation protein Spo0J